MKMKTLKSQKTRLLNKQVETIEQFEEVQNKLNMIEMEMLVVKMEGGE